MITVDELKELLGVKEDQELGPLFDRKKAAISAWRRDGVPPAIELKAREMRKSTIINGTGHYIDITNVADKEEVYSPATAMLLDIIREWSEKKRRKLAAYAVNLNGDDQEEA